jgi:hypothetical protein
MCGCARGESRYDEHRASWDRSEVVSRMPTIRTFYGILIQMFWRDHAPPHFHALDAEHEVLIDIRTLDILEGTMPRRALALILEWAQEHRTERMEDWDLCTHNQPPNPICPLP